MSSDLPGDRVLAARFDQPLQPQRTRFLLLLVLVATAIGIAAWPIVRHLTRRLERLRSGVDAFGTGALVTRVPVEGRDEIAAVAKSFNRAAGEIERLVADRTARCSPMRAMNCARPLRGCAWRSISCRRKPTRRGAPRSSAASARSTRGSRKSCSPAASDHLREVGRDRAARPGWRWRPKRRPCTG